MTETPEERAKQMVNYWWNSGAIAHLNDRRLVEGQIAAEIRAAVEAESRCHKHPEMLKIQCARCARIDIEAAEDAALERAAKHLDKYQYYESANQVRKLKSGAKR